MQNESGGVGGEEGEDGGSVCLWGGVNGGRKEGQNTEAESGESAI